MSKTTRNLPEWAKRTEWLVPAHKVQYFPFSGVRTLKGDRGDGRNEGWAEDTGPNAKRIGKRTARKCARRFSRKLERDFS